MPKKINNELRIEKLLTSWGIIVILWSLFRNGFNPPLWFSELVAKPLIFLGPVYWFVSNNEKANRFFQNVGFPKKGLGRELFLTLLLMLLIIGFGLLSLFTSQGIKVVFVNQLDINRWGALFGLALVSAFSEEIVGRGFLFNYLYRYSKNFLLSLFISSTLFFILYLPGALTLGLGGQDLVINLVLNFTLSFITGIAFYMRKNILPAIGVHAMVVFWFDLLLS
ncbi:hypothetical protein A2313_02075 [Candidatus Roizmanbacteria bacterium RIFOXYB2_FULL_41_10]|uniref:CAAX prenyl protease 2/Lysostaphin resistance protein A-like domain-containing protein n=1 Tax=Candidatus Roizmanbacteria bacterium RIFOXYA1_FULL_41_12 TaxID=1802082 RepID=A0A1F7KAA0_9BACT|nr:MAG: hypothetical protein A2209_00320 [Candidatus Roizmanbacteria bacterium RIFOXYA1_FULL_41_12]OGK67574.1 MAG: hypothetical protein A2377_01875 [Candidatus Roizmanbacteria bacterium RIFOXYB1_FULL_41_27]OGK70979.1 MAG: hypothetical protein A2313_02075 [Candidatus Roizmanbacteria bacterium RIFOXYB2_FULL_41_10]OGK71230.1 MAG: hypothetical protein A2403_00605 [Candidatus Roizmanbacteria bacterium RIFOXYC1_FULL_41_16]OGK74631.1 MAG: hypothetical protein A2575_01315 [Candidatus Roizmanbacteria ba